MYTRSSSLVTGCDVRARDDVKDLSAQLFDQRPMLDSVGKR